MPIWAPTIRPLMRWMRASPAILNQRTPTSTSAVSRRDVFRSCTRAPLEFHA
jgi:hypothetical protein